jgi:hypothetical protein
MSSLWQGFRCRFRSSPRTGVRSLGRSAILAIVVTISLCAVSVLGSTVYRTYQWLFQGRYFTLTHGFPLERYRYFQALPRIVAHSQYSAYVTDSHDDDELAFLVAELEKAARSANLNVWEKLNLIIAFVQSIPYVPEAEEYARYPLETLIEQKGDCEDSSILTAAILHEMGYYVVLLVFLEEQHIATGISVLPPKPGNYRSYRYAGRDYYYVETTCEGWQIGIIPQRYTSTPEIVALDQTTVGLFDPRVWSFGKESVVQNPHFSQ